MPEQGKGAPSITDKHGRQLCSVECGHLVIDAPRYRVTWKGHKVAIIRQPLLVLGYLARRPGHVRTREQILDYLYDGRDLDTFDTVGDNAVRHIRAAFRRVDPTFRQIVTLYAVGYKWSEDDL